MNMTYLVKGAESQHIAKLTVYTRGTKQAHAMAQEKRVLVKLGERNRAMAFLPNGENDQEVLKEAIKSVYCDEIPETSDFILQDKEEVWGGEFVHISPSQTKIANSSIMKVIVKKVSISMVVFLLKDRPGFKMATYT